MQDGVPCEPLFIYYLHIDKNEKYWQISFEVTNEKYGHLLGWLMTWKTVFKERQEQETAKNHFQYSIM
jgi:hypothetical protein